MPNSFIMDDTLVTMTDYITPAFADDDKLVTEAEYALKNVEFDTVVGTGISGALVAPLLARWMGKNLVIVRKENVDTHAYRPIEGKLGHRWLFVDDLVCTGATLRRVVKAVDTLTFNLSFDWKTEYVGTYLYSYGGTYHAPGYERTSIY